MTRPADKYTPPKYPSDPQRRAPGSQHLTIAHSFKARNQFAPTVCKYCAQLISHPNHYPNPFRDV